VDDNGETIERLREYCDNGIKYYTWALERMPSIPEQADRVGQVRTLRSSLAHVLAYIEGATDERGGMLRRDEIVKRYEKSVRDEGWKPPFAPGES
jgi:hypothetical protein